MSRVVEGIDEFEEGSDFVYNLLHDDFKGEFVSEVVEKLRDYKRVPPGTMLPASAYVVYMPKLFKDLKAGGVVVAQDKKHISLSSANYFWKICYRKNHIFIKKTISKLRKSAFRKHLEKFLE